jgi:chromosome segregation ATPase
MPVEDELKSAQEGKNLLASMVVDLENELEGAKSEKADAYVDNASLANEVRRLEGVCAELTAERDNLIKESAAEKSTMQKSIEELQGQIDGLVFDRDAAEKARKRSEDAWRLERQNLEEQLRKGRHFNDELNEQLATKEIDLARSLAEKQEARHVSRSERQMRELFEGHLSEAKNHQDFLRQRMRELEAEAAEATKQYHKVGDTVYSLQDRCTELEQAKAALAKTASSTEAMLNDEIASLKAELAKVSSECESFSKHVVDLKEMLINEKKTNSRKTDEISTQAAEIVKLKAKLLDNNDDEQLLCQQVNQLKETITLLSKEKQGMLQQKSGEKETYMEELRVLRQALTMAEQNTEAALTQARMEKNQVTAEMQDVAEQLASSQAETASLQSQLDTAEAAVARALADKEELEGETRYLTGESRELIAQLSSVRAAKEARDVEIAELQVLLRSQEVELQDDRADLTRTTVKTDTAVMIRDQDEMRATFEKLRDDNELLHAQVAQLNEHIQHMELNNRRLEVEVGTANANTQAAAAATHAAAVAQNVHITMPEEFRGLVGENERMRDRIIALEEELAQTIATKEVDRSILEEQLHFAEARAEKAELVDEIEDKLRESLEEVARLESELVQTRAEAAERDIQWQAEVDALADTYEQLQMELKKRERDIEEMKEGAWLSAELQYMAKKVEDAEIAERRHIQESREVMDKLESKDSELALMAAKADEAAGTLRSLEGELNDERFTNKDLIREVHNLRLDVERAELEKEKALAAAEMFVQRTVESTSADRETLKGALNQLGSSLDTIRADRARALAEKEATISEKNAMIYKLTADLEAMTAMMEDFKNQLATCQKMLKASMAASASRFGMTLSNVRSRMMSSGFSQWCAWLQLARLESKIEELEFQNDLYKNAGRMIALKRVLGRWANQKLLMGWSEWHALWTENSEARRLNKLLANMTDAERAKALERLNNILAFWKGEHIKAMFSVWKKLPFDAKQLRKKMNFAMGKWANQKLAAGFNTWKLLLSMTAEERAQMEINDLKYRLQICFTRWHADKFMYESRIYTEAQRSRLFQLWKYQTQVVARTTMRMKMMLGTLRRDKGRVAFQRYKDAVAKSRQFASDALDARLLAKAKEAALMKMSRVISHAKNATMAAMWRTWLDDVEMTRYEKLEAEYQKQLAAEELKGYQRCRAEYEPQLAFLQDLVFKMRQSAFGKYINLFLGDVEKRGKIYAMGQWRTYVKDGWGRSEEERRQKELQQLQDQLKAALAEAAALKDERTALKRQLLDLQNSLADTESSLQDQLRQLRREAENARRDAELIQNTADLQIKNLEVSLKNKERQLEDQQQEFSEKEVRHLRRIQHLETMKNELESDKEGETIARKELSRKNRDLALKVENDIMMLREDVSKAEAEKRRAQNDHDIIAMSQKETIARLAGEQAESSKLRSENNKLEQQLDAANSDLSKLKAQLDRAMQAQSDLDIVKGAAGSK